MINFVTWLSWWIYRRIHLRRSHLRKTRRRYTHQWSAFHNIMIWRKATRTMRHLGNWLWLHFDDFDFLMSWLELKQFILKHRLHQQFLLVKLNIFHLDLHLHLVFEKFLHKLLLWALKGWVGLYWAHVINLSLVRILDLLAYILSFKREFSFWLVMRMTR